VDVHTPNDRKIMFQQVSSNRNETAKLEGGKPIFDFCELKRQTDGMHTNTENEIGMGEDSSVQSIKGISQARAARQQFQGENHRDTTMLCHVRHSGMRLPRVGGPRQTELWNCKQSCRLGLTGANTYHRTTTPPLFFPSDCSESRLCM
jgi:phenylpropionate dioxygenase-like ring-hydroxylating dioxygenase large terminal subunit